MPPPSDLLATALAHHQAGRLQEAEETYRQIIAIEPRNAEALNNLGNLLADCAKLNDAVQCLRKAVEAQADFAEGFYNLGHVLQRQGSFSEAASCYETALRLSPALADAENNLGRLRYEQGAIEEGIARFRRALALNPNMPEAHCSLGAALFKVCEYELAETHVRRALATDCTYAEAWGNLGTILKERGYFDQAEAALNQALELQPDLANVRLGRALLRLLVGRFREGWTEYEYRWRVGKLAPRVYPQPRWSGESLRGKTLFIYDEQGFGDTIQFVRYAALVKQQGATVIFECEPALQGLLSRYSNIDQLVPRGQAIPPFDYHSPLLSLPNIFNTSLASIPVDVPYLSAPPELVQYWRTRLAPFRGFRIGVNWRGRDEPESRLRDVPLVHLASLADVANVHLISLQKGTGQQELRAQQGRTPIVELGDLDTAHGPFIDTAAIMMSLDLVITSDTAVAHLAGALGVPVWVLLKSVPDWRWLLNRGDCPWYPTMRLFRQARPGDWESVLKSVGAALQKRPLS